MLADRMSFDMLCAQGPIPGAWSWVNSLSLSDCTNSAILQTGTFPYATKDTFTPNDSK